MASGLAVAKSFDLPPLCPPLFIRSGENASLYRALRPMRLSPPGSSSPPNAPCAAACGARPPASCRSSHGKTCGRFETDLVAAAAAPPSR